MSRLQSFIFKTIFLIIMISPVFNPLIAQDEFPFTRTPVMHESRDWTISASPNYINHPNAYPRIVGGVNAMVFIGEHISLNASIAGGQGYFHVGTGVIGVPIILLLGIGFLTESTDIESFLVMVAMLGLAFENMNFHIPVFSHFEISPYFSLLRLKYIEEGYGGNGSPWNANLVGGLRLNIFTSDRFFIAPYAEATRDWGHGRNGTWGVNGGLHAGFYFKHK